MKSIQARKRLLEIPLEMIKGAPDESSVRQGDEGPGMVVWEDFAGFLLKSRRDATVWEDPVVLLVSG